MEFVYSTWLIVEGEILEELQWTNYEPAQKRFLELLYLYMDNDFQMVSIGCTIEKVPLHNILYHGLPEHTFENNVVAEMQDQILPFDLEYPENVDPDLVNTRRIWTWIQVAEDGTIWTTIPVEDFLQSCSSTSSAITEIET
jgi:hypothetical protein